MSHTTSETITCEPVFLPGFMGRNVLPRDLIVSVSNHNGHAGLEDGRMEAPNPRAMALLPLIIPLTGIGLGIVVLSSQRA